MMIGAFGFYNISYKFMAISSIKIGNYLVFYLIELFLLQRLNCKFYILLIIKSLEQMIIYYSKINLNLINHVF